MNNLEKWQLLCSEMRARYPVLAEVWAQAPRRFGPGWADESIPELETIYGPVTHPLSDDLYSLMDGYAEFSDDSLRNQVYYERTGRYRASSHAEVSRHCYHNEEHMNRRYLPGLVTSHYVWPQHYN